jgi:hypothetical protein
MKLHLYWLPKKPKCPACGDVMNDYHSNYQPVWSDRHDDVVCWWCATHDGAADQSRPTRKPKWRTNDQVGLGD